MGEGTINDVTVNVDTKVDLHNIIVIKHGLVSGVRGIVRGTMVQRDTRWETHTTLERISSGRHISHLFLNHLHYFNHGHTWFHVLLCILTCSSMNFSTLSELIPRLFRFDTVCIGTLFLVRGTLEVVVLVFTRWVDTVEDLVNIVFKYRAGLLLLLSLLLLLARVYRGCFSSHGASVLHTQRCNIVGDLLNSSSSSLVTHCVAVRAPTGSLCAVISKRAPLNSTKRKVDSSTFTFGTEISSSTVQRFLKQSLFSTAGPLGAKLTVDTQPAHTHPTCFADL